MAKTSYEYKTVQVPVEVAEHVNKIHAKRKAKASETRKADVWLDMLKVKK